MRHDCPLHRLEKDNAQSGWSMCGLHALHYGRAVAAVRQYCQQNVRRHQKKVELDYVQQAPFATVYIKIRLVHCNIKTKNKVRNKPLHQNVH